MNVLHMTGGVFGNLHGNLDLERTGSPLGLGSLRWSL